MTAERRFFYTAWALLWVFAAALLSVIVSPRLHDEFTVFDPESWFAMFPVAWTGALWITRYRERRHPYLCSRPIQERVRDLAIAVMLAFLSNDAWTRYGTGHKEKVFLMAVVDCMVLIALVQAEAKAWRGRRSPSP